MFNNTVASAVAGLVKAQRNLAKVIAKREAAAEKKHVETERLLVAMGEDREEANNARVVLGKLTDITGITDGV
jgi:hypothetical protein